MTIRHLARRHAATPPTRREFLATAGAATLGALAAGYPRAVWAQSPEKITPTADTLIVLWMGGGMAHTETFDPKRYTPFERGMRPEQVLSTFPSIDTAVDGIRFSQGLEKIARVMDRGTLIRSYTAGDLGFILHSRHQYHWHTGYAPPQTVAAPHLGAVIARTLGPREPAVPAFINIGQRFDLGEGEELKAFTTAGFLGSEHGPFNIPFPEDAADSVRPARRDDAGALRGSRPLLQATARGEPDRPARQRVPAGIAAALDGQRASPPQLARRQGVRSVARAARARPQVRARIRARAALPRGAGSLRRQLREADGGTLRARLPARAAAHAKWARASSRSRRSTFRS